MFTSQNYLLIAIVLLLFSSCWNTQQQRKQKAQEYGHQAYIEAEKGNYQQALHYSNEAIKLDDKDPALYYNGGYIKHCIGDTLGAITDYQKSFSLDTSWEDPLCNLANLYLEQNKIQESQQVYQQAIRINPNGLRGYHGLGFLFYTIQQYDSAIPYLEQVIEKYPIAIQQKDKDYVSGYNMGNAEIRGASYFFLGLCYWHTGNIGKAKYYLSLAIQERMRGAKDSLNIINHFETKK